MIDIDYYGQETLFTQQQRSTEVTFHAEHIAAIDEISISTGSVFEIVTQGGACYTQTIDVCLDHALGHSKQLMSKRILNDADPNELLPEQIEQCITSASIRIFSDSTIADRVTHADPIYSMHEHHHEPLGRCTLTEEAMQRIIPNSFNNMTIDRSKTGYEINNPAFGSDCIIEVLEERTASKYRPELQGAVIQHNQQVCKRRVELVKHHGEIEHDILAQKIVSKNGGFDQTKNDLQQLKQTMLNQCRPGFLQWLFKTEEYKQKLEAKKIITNSFDLMSDIINDHKSGSLLFIQGWQKDLALRLNFIGSIGASSPLKLSLTNTLTSEIKEFVVKLEKNTGCDIDEKDYESRNKLD